MSIFNDKSLKGVADAVSKIMEASKKEENKFHNKLDKLVHGTFGDSPDEKKMKKEETELSPKQKAIAKLDHPKHKIDGGDLAKLRAGHKPVKEETESCEDEAEEAVDKHEKKMHGKKGEVSKHEKEMHKESFTSLIESYKKNGLKSLSKMKKEEVDLEEANVKKYAKMGATNRTTHFVKNTTTGKIESPHVGIKDAERGLTATQLLNPKHEFSIVRAQKMKKEEVDNETYEKEMKDQKDKFDGKKKGADVAKASVQAVKQEEVELNEISKELATKVAAKRLVNVQKDALILTHPHPDDIKKLHKTMDLVKKRYGNSQVKKISSVADKMYNEEQIDEEEVDQLDENYIKYSDSSDSYTGKYKGKSFKVKAPGQSHQLTSTHVEKHNLHLDSEHSKKLAKHLRHYYRNVNHGEKYNISEEVELDEADQYTIQNTKTKQTYHASKYPITKDSEKYKKIKAAGGDHAHATIYKNGKPVTEESELDEAEKMKGEDPCWKDYEMVGHKMKNGKKVPNCVPKNEEVEVESELVESILANVAGKLANAAGVHPKKVADSFVSSLDKKATGTKMQNHPNFSKFKKDVHAYVSSAKDAHEAISRSSDDHVMSLGKKHFSEEVELEERTLTEPEAKKKEEIVKSMKKKMAGFKERYGERAKSVAYATATRIAKEKA